METEEIKVVLTSELAFGLKKDGSLVIDNDPNPTKYLTLFRALAQYAQSLRGDDLMAFTLANLVMHSQIDSAVMLALEMEKSELKNKKEE